MNELNTWIAFDPFPSNLASSLTLSWHSVTPVRNSTVDATFASTAGTIPSFRANFGKKKKKASQMPLQFNFRFFFINKKSLRWLIAIGCRQSLWSVRHAVNNFTFLKLLENYKANCVWLEAFLWYEKYKTNFLSIKFQQ